MTRRIIIIDRIIPAIRKHIVTQEALPCGCKRICIDKPTNAGVVVTALEVVEPGFDRGAMILAI